VVERTGGVPLFVEELTRAVLESGDAGLTRRAIPVTLHDSLMARLDRLGPAREVLQTGVALGSDFSYALLHAVHPIAEGQLQAALLQPMRNCCTCAASHRARATSSSTR
jgi:predicted ATPase